MPPATMARLSGMVAMRDDDAASTRPGGLEATAATSARTQGIDASLTDDYGITQGRRHGQP